MLRSLKSIEGYGLGAKDGQLGKTKDFYFDDVSWRVRYAVVDTKRWLPGRRVLVSPTSFQEPEWERSVIPTSLTKDQVRESPSIEEDRPVSRQHEVALARYFAWPVYWTPPPGAAALAVSAAQSPTATATETEVRASTDGDPHLRSLDEVTGYSVHALDEEVGAVSDLIVETKSWTIRYLVADTRKLLPGGKVLLSPEWIHEVRWEERAVRVDLYAESIKACPPYRPSHAVNREYEERIYDYYGRPRYWA